MTGTATGEDGRSVVTGAYTSTVDCRRLEPMTAEEIGLTNVTGDPHMLVHQLRSTSGELGDVWAAVVTLDPCSFDYTFAGDETIHVLEGEGTVELLDGQTVDLAPGTIASFAKGVSSHWRIHSRLREFAVLTGSGTPTP